jgi:hypothetical protein
MTKRRQRSNNYQIQIQLLIALLAVHFAHQHALLLKHLTQPPLVKQQVPQPQQLCTTIPPAGLRLRPPLLHRAVLRVRPLVEAHLRARDRPELPVQMRRIVAMRCHRRVHAACIAGCGRLCGCERLRGRRCVRLCHSRQVRGSVGRALRVGMSACIVAPARHGGGAVRGSGRRMEPLGTSKLRPARPAQRVQEPTPSQTANRVDGRRILFLNYSYISIYLRILWNPQKRPIFGARGVINGRFAKRASAPPRTNGP